MAPSSRVAPYSSGRLSLAEARDDADFLSREMSGVGLTGPRGAGGAKNNMMAGDGGECRSLRTVLITGFLMLAFGAGVAALVMWLVLGNGEPAADPAPAPAGRAFRRVGQAVGIGLPIAAFDESATTSTVTKSVVVDISVRRGASDAAFARAPQAGEADLSLTVTREGRRVTSVVVNESKSDIQCTTDGVPGNLVVGVLYADGGAVIVFDVVENGEFDPALLKRWMRATVKASTSSDVTAGGPGIDGTGFGVLPFSSPQAIEGTGFEESASVGWLLASTAAEFMGEGPDLTNVDVEAVKTPSTGCPYSDTMG